MINPQLGGDFTRKTFFLFGTSKNEKEANKGKTQSNARNAAAKDTIKTESDSPTQVSCKDISGGIAVIGLAYDY
jgi:hypothetical protein